MNLLIDSLPTSVEIDGTKWPINSDFYIGVKFELVAQNPKLSDEEKVAQALELYYPKIPRDRAVAIKRLLWFYSCGRSDEEKASAGKAKKVKKSYDFEQDADLIFSAFMGQYGIDLNDVVTLHWWKFRALFAGLSSECELRKVMGYRTADTTGMSKTQKKFYEEMKALYALRSEADAASALSLAERNQKMKEYVARRFKEMEGANEGQRVR